MKVILPELEQKYQSPKSKLKLSISKKGIEIKGLKNNSLEYVARNANNKNYFILENPKNSSKGTEYKLHIGTPENLLEATVLGVNTEQRVTIVRYLFNGLKGSMILPEPAVQDKDFFPCFQYSGRSLRLELLDIPKIGQYKHTIKRK